MAERGGPLAWLARLFGGGRDRTPTRKPASIPPRDHRFPTGLLQEEGAPRPPAIRGRYNARGLSVRGRDIVDPSGRPILLRGWNWGRWGRVLPNDGADNAAQGANVVRIPLRWWGLYHGPDVDSRDDSARATACIDAEHLAMLDDYVRWASQARLWIVLFIDSNCGQDGTQTDEMVRYCDPTGAHPGGHNFWTDRAERARFIALWRFIANRYKDAPYLGMFEPLPEPNPKSASAAQITAFYEEVMAAIRAVAPGVPFLVGARLYRAIQAHEAYNRTWNDVVYTGNLFVRRSGNTNNFNRRLQSLLDLRAYRNVPVFVQQVGVRSGDDPHQTELRHALASLVEERVGFTYWEYRGGPNADEFGAYYLQGDEWVCKPRELAAVSSFFRG